jgi:hypothetical protein
MTTSRSQMPDDEIDGGRVDSPDDGTPELNVYEIHSDRTVFTEPNNTDGWIAADETVVPPQ